ncbi:hypothetical protein D3C72_1087190 [compost metagenome]
MLNKLNIALSPDPAFDARRAADARRSETARAAVSASRVSFHPAFGNGDTPHYGL